MLIINSYAIRSVIQGLTGPSQNGDVMSEAVLKRMVILANLVQFEHEVTEGERPVVFLFL